MLNHQKISCGYSFVEPGSDVSSDVHRHTKVRMLCPLTDGEGAGRPLSSQCVGWVVMGQCLGVSTWILGSYVLFWKIPATGPFLTSHGPIFFPKFHRLKSEKSHQLMLTTSLNHQRIAIDALYYHALAIDNMKCSWWTKHTKAYQSQLLLIRPLK